MIQLIERISTWWNLLNRGTEEMIYRGIAGIFIALTIGILIGLVSYIVRCDTDENFY